MPKITFIEPDGTRKVIDAPVGVSLMKAALGDSVDGVLAECGGCCMCATCHVYLEPDSFTDSNLVENLSEDESELLDCTVCPRQSTSRLSCQIIVAEEHEGLVVRVPEAQM